MISSDDQMISNEINSNQMKSDDQQTISNDFIKAQETVIHVKDEMIQMLRIALDRAEKRIEHLEGSNDQLAGQNNRLTQLTYLLMAPERKPNAEANEHTRHRDAYTMPPDNDEFENENTPEPQEESWQQPEAYQASAAETNDQQFSPPTSGPAAA
jgi:hypothetical protein